LITERSLFNQRTIKPTRGLSYFEKVLGAAADSVCCAIGPTFIPIDPKGQHCSYAKIGSHYAASSSQKLSLSK
jgi:hypothetical protein